MSRILMLVSSADSLALADRTAHPTGVWAEELVVAHEGLTAAGHDVVLVTPDGAAPTIDPASLRADVVGSPERAAELAAGVAALAPVLASPTALADASLRGVAAVVIPGGHGPMADLAVDPAVGALLTAADAAGVVIAPFCHGPAALVAAVDAEGAFAFAGRRLTVFTDGEELAGGLGDGAPWFVAHRLSALGAIVEAGAPWSSHVVVDGTLITGQNPQSSEAVVAAVLDALR